MFGHKLSDGILHRLRDKHAPLLDVAAMAVGQSMLVVDHMLPAIQFDSLLELFHEGLDANRVDAELRVEHGVGVVGRKFHFVRRRLRCTLLQRTRYLIGNAYQRVYRVGFYDEKWFAQDLKR